MDGDLPNGWNERCVGLDEQLPLLDGRLARYIHLDNAASTPPLVEVADAASVRKAMSRICCDSHERSERAWNASTSQASARGGREWCA